jgi:5S rRNA maturation endonuclease (ribonuclease M5)
VDDALDLVLGRLDGVRQHGGYWMARCPAHDDREASLSIARGTEQPVVFKCHAGCDRDAILNALGLTLADVSKPLEERREEWTPRGPAIAVYDYTGENGELLFQVCRTADKQFPQRRPDPATRSGWSWKLGNVRRVPYRLPQLLAAVAAGKTIYVAEGEKDVHALERAGAAATTSPGGAGKWRSDYDSYFTGADVVIIADADEPGRKHAADIARHLAGTASSVAIREAATGKDAADHLAAGHTLAEFGDPRKPPLPPAPACDGSALLDDVHLFLGRFVAYPSAHAHIAHTLWVAHTHLMDAWESTPRLAFISPEPGSGKTRGLEVSELLVQRPVEAINTTPAYLFRKVSDPDGLPVILHDEVDTLFGPRSAKDNEEIRGLLNAGHRRGAMAGRCVVKGKIIETEELSAYCAVALAGLGDLPDTLMSRSVVIRMRRRKPDEHVEPYRRRLHKTAGHALRDRLTAWAAYIMPKVNGTWPQMPDGIEDRAADVWEALLAVADAAGGDWPTTAREAAVALVADSKSATPSLGIRLLADLRDIFGDTEAMSTEAILTALHGIEEAPWADLKGKPLNARGLAARLRQYEVRSVNVRIGDSVPKGYRREDLYDPWSRYLGGVSVGVASKESATSATSATTPTCTACGQPLDPALAAIGDTTHPNCANDQLSW